jgi:predicted TIM-barrel fold metal-dependent hydrolase
MIIDAHVHVGRMPGIRGDIAQVLRLADRAGFDHIVCSHAGAFSYDMREGNSELGSAMRRHPDRISGYVAITSARYGRLALEEIQRCYETYGMKGLKILHRVGGLGSYGIITSINEPLMYPLIEKAAELGLPVLAHSTPEECEGLLQRVPEAVIIMAHSGGCPTALGDWHKAIATAQRCPNLYLDTTSSVVDMGYVEALVEGVGPERVIFGTDMPLLDPFTQLAKITTGDLSPEQKALVLRGNAARLFKLKV